MSFSTVAGSALYVCASQPATNTVGDFAALAWTKVGELTDLGSVKGREYNTSTHAPIDSSQQIEKKASYKLPNADFTVAWDEDDAGQIIIEAGSKTNDIYAFKLVKQDASIRYFTAQVLKFVENHGTVDNVVQGQFALLRQTDSLTA